MTIETRQTLEFLAPYLTSPDSRWLEVGCGKGELALAMSSQADVLPIDSSETAVMAALQLGVNAQLMDFFGIPDAAQKFDFVLFTRSLHHIQPLDKAVEKAVKLLNPNGRVIIEDFAAEIADAATVEWYFRTRNDLIGAGLLSPHAAHHQIDASGNPLSWWKQHHFETHHVATSAQLRAAIAGCFSIEKESFVPYMYRYLVTDLLPGIDAAEVEWAILDDEERQCAEGRMRLIGYRLVAAQK